MQARSLLKTITSFVGANWVNPEDPNVIAENELLGAAAAIEAAARKLAELKPKPRPKVVVQNVMKKKKESIKRIVIVSVLYRTDTLSALL